MYKITRTAAAAKKPAPIHTEDEAITWLNKFRYAREFRDERGHPQVPIACFCDFAGVSRLTVYRFMRGDQISARYRQRLLVAIEAVRAGLRWKRQADHSYVVTDPARFSAFPRYERPCKAGT